MTTLRERLAQMGADPAGGYPDFGPDVAAALVAVAEASAGPDAYSAAAEEVYQILRWYSKGIITSARTEADENELRDALSAFEVASDSDAFRGDEDIQRWPPVKSNGVGVHGAARGYRPSRGGGRHGVAVTLRERLEQMLDVAEQLDEQLDEHWVHVTEDGTLGSVRTACGKDIAQTQQRVADPAHVRRNLAATHIANMSPDVAAAMIAVIASVAVDRVALRATTAKALDRLSALLEVSR